MHDWNKEYEGRERIERRVRKERNAGEKIQEERSGEGG